jgi:hypothetical protein
MRRSGKYFNANRNVLQFAATAAGFPAAYGLAGRR